jgi:NAD(P)-dependent dehydrogenase (short-subunit alcohol dehydrogenase family)
LSQLDLSTRVILITGGAQGIGAAVAVACARSGAIVYVFDVAEEAGAALAAEHEAISFRKVDVSDRAAVQSTVSDIVDRHGRVDGLVCSAVVQPLISVLDIDEASWRRVLEVNLNGVLWCCQAALPTMIERRAGSIVLFVSGTAELGKARSAPYTTSKGAVAGFAKTLAREVAEYNVRVNTCRPGIVDTPQFRASNPGADTSRLDQPEDVVGPVLFLLSDYATMSGSTVTRELPYRQFLPVPA